MPDSIFQPLIENVQAYLPDSSTLENVQGYIPEPLLQAVINYWALIIDHQRQKDEFQHRAFATAKDITADLWYEAYKYLTSHPKQPMLTMVEPVPQASQIPESYPVAPIGLEDPSSDFYHSIKLMLAGGAITLGTGLAAVYLWRRFLTTPEDVPVVEPSSVDPSEPPNRIVLHEQPEGLVRYMGPSILPGPFSSPIGHFVEDIPSGTPVVPTAPHEERTSSETPAGRTTPDERDSSPETPEASNPQGTNYNFQGMFGNNNSYVGGDVTNISITINFGNGPFNQTGTNQSQPSPQGSTESTKPHQSHRSSAKIVELPNQEPKGAHKKFIYGDYGDVDTVNPFVNGKTPKLMGTPAPSLTDVIYLDHSAVPKCLKPAFEAKRNLDEFDAQVKAWRKFTDEGRTRVYNFLKESSDLASHIKTKEQYIVFNETFRKERNYEWGKREFKYTYPDKENPSLFIRGLGINQIENLKSEITAAKIAATQNAAEYDSLLLELEAHQQELAQQNKDIKHHYVVGPKTFAEEHIYLFRKAIDLDLKSPATYPFNSGAIKNDRVEFLVRTERDVIGFNDHKEYEHTSSLLLPFVHTKTEAWLPKCTVGDEQETSYNHAIRQSVATIEIMITVLADGWTTFKLSKKPELVKVASYFLIGTGLITSKQISLEDDIEGFNVKSLTKANWLTLLDSDASLGEEYKSVIKGFLSVNEEDALQAAHGTTKTAESAKSHQGISITNINQLTTLYREYFEKNTQKLDQVEPAYLKRFEQSANTTGMQAESLRR